MQEFRAASDQLSTLSTEELNVVAKVLRIRNLKTEASTTRSFLLPLTSMLLLKLIWVVQMRRDSQKLTTCLRIGVLKTTTNL